MPQQFDATLKDLIRTYPADWLTPFGIAVTETPEVLSAELSTVSAAADMLVRVGGRIIHLDVQSGPDPALARRMLLYNVLAHHHTELPVRSVVVLLRSNAQQPELQGHHEYEELSFRFQIVRAWELPADDFLNAGIGLMPLAVLGKPPRGRSRRQALHDQVVQMVQRLEAVPKPEADKVLTAAYILAGMHLEPAIARGIFQKVLAMHESATYQLILDEGAIRQAHETILRQGRQRFDAPSEKILARIRSIEDLERLNRILDKVLSASSWESLLRVC